MTKGKSSQIIMESNYSLYKGFGYLINVNFLPTKWPCLINEFYAQYFL